MSDAGRMSDAESLEGIAIVGMAGRFPRARDVAELWRNLRDGVDCVSYFADSELEVPVPPEVLASPGYVKARGVLEDADLFDAGFFDIAPRQAELMDPQNRLFLEQAWHALEDAGYDPARVAGPIGVFGGVTLSSYVLNNLLGNPELLRTVGAYQVAIGTDRDYLTTFVSYKLDLRGPSLDVQTACSTSLVATVLACQSLLSYQCDMALAGGVSIKVPQKAGYPYTPGGLDSLRGQCRSFDAAADGSVYGSGVGVVVLKRLEDALADGDTVWAVIRGGALNNDGSARVGFTAPGVDGQAEVISTAQALAGVDPETVGYVECHGSGTALGDPIEVAALTKAFRAAGSQRRQYCAIGSIKSNLGHCAAAAGVAGLMKASLALHHRQIPPSLHFEKPNPAIDFAASPFFVADRLAEWPANGEPRRAGVSSFGMGGTNAHVVLEEAPAPEPSSGSRPWQLLLLSARGEAALEAATDRLAADLTAHPERPLADVAWTLQVGRRAFAHRRVLVCRDTEEAQKMLAGRDPRRLLSASGAAGRRPVAFLLPGVGDHYEGMARGLYEGEPVFREHLDRCAKLLAPRLGCDLREVMWPAGEQGGEVGAGPDLRRMLGRDPHTGNESSPLHRTLYAQPAVFAVEYALAQLWMEWGVRPAALLGYSLGEYTAACLAGVLSLEDALLLVAERAHLIDGLRPGAMLAVPLTEDEARARIAGTGLDLCAVNAPAVCVIGGPDGIVAALAERLAREGVPARRLPTTHAFHTRMMDPVASALTRLVRGIKLAPPQIPYVSNVTGTWVTPAEAVDPESWTRHLLQPVRFAAGLATLWSDPSRVLLEVGPGFGLSTLAMQQPVGLTAQDAPARPGLTPGATQFRPPGSENLGSPEPGGRHSVAQGVNPGRGSEGADRIALPSLRNQHDPQPDQAFLLGTLGKLWLAGVEPDWAGFSRHEKRRRVRLPGYPFERTRYWVEPSRTGVVEQAGTRQDLRREIVHGGLDRQIEQARRLAPGAHLVLVEDDATARLIARLRELEALGGEIRVVGRSDAARLAAELAAEPAGARPALAAHHPRPALRNPYVAPEGSLQVRIADIFEELLGIRGVGAHDSFFELGGHSLLATQLLSRVRDRFGAEIPLPVLFQEPTVAGLAAQVTDRGGTVEEAGAPPLVRLARDGGDLPLSYAQQRLWFLDRLIPGNPFYNLPGGVRLTGPLAVPALRAAFQELSRRHETLRTGFADLAGRPVQRIADRIDAGLPEIELSALPEAHREEAVRHIAAVFGGQPFDLSRPGLLRVALLRLADEDHVLLFTMHHIVSDGWSLGVLTREAAVLYDAFSRGLPSPLPELPIQYADFAAWQRRWLSAGELQRQLAWWHERLTGAPVLDLPTDRPRPPVQTFRGGLVRTLYPRPLLDALGALATGRGVSLFMVLLGAFQALLMRYTGQEDVVVGSPIANRTRSELEGLIGFFVNTLVLRSDLAGDPAFSGLLEQVRPVCLGAYAHQDLPFEQLVEEMHPRRDLSRNPLFQVMLNLLNQPPQRADVSSRLTMTQLLGESGASLFDLQAYVTPLDDGLSIRWEHAADLFDTATIERLSRHFETLLAGIAEQPESRLSELPLLSAAERRQLVEGWNATAMPRPAEPTVHALFEAQVRRTPDALALVAPETGETLTYADLNAWADRLARHLRQRGVRPGVLIAVCLERSPDLVAALLGVLKAGGAYVPLDPAHPAERLAYVLEDSGAAVLLTEPRLRGRIPAGGAELVEAGPGLLAEDGAGSLQPLAGPDDLAYVIYTSGSTGRPKGVEVTHGAMVNFLAAMARQPGLTAADALLAVTTVSFDIAGLELYLPLSVGARIVLAGREAALDGGRLAAMISSAGVTALQATPATWRLLLASGWPGAPGLLALCGGEALPRDLAAELVPRTGSLWNVYGPTETTVWSMLRRVDGDGEGPLPIGLPVANTAVHLLDRSGSLVPVGVAGELHIGGAGLARGYLRRPDLTAERFVPDPFSGERGARLYRTGDLARRLREGEVEFLGRIDHQVKIRGFRVELGEIEAVLARDPAVRQAVALLREDTPGDQRLTAYVVWEDAERRDLGRLREALQARLPAYMVPGVFVELEALPLTPSGKVDRKALPKPGGERPDLEKPYVAPRNETEAAVAEIWSAVLGLDKPGVHDDFFELGGHSLLATQVVSRLRDRFGLELPLPVLFQETTLERLAARIEAERGRDAPAPPPLSIQPSRRRSHAAERALARLEAMSDDEVQELLRRKREAAGGGSE